MRHPVWSARDHGPPREPLEATIVGGFTLRTCSRKDRPKPPPRKTYRVTPPREFVGALWEAVLGRGTNNNHTPMTPRGRRILASSAAGAPSSPPSSLGAGRAAWTEACLYRYGGGKDGLGMMPELTFGASFAASRAGDVRKGPGPPKTGRQSKVSGG